jgi:hypothetical protein
VGAVFIAGAVVALSAPRWPALGAGTRVGLLVATAVLLVTAGLAVGVAGGGLRTLRTPALARRRRLAGALFTAGAGAFSGALLSVHRDGDVVGPATGASDLVLAASLLLATLAVLGYAAAPTAVGQMAALLGATASAALAWQAAGRDGGLATGLTVMTLGGAWLVLAERRVWREPVLARSSGAALLLAGAQIPVAEHVLAGYGLTALVGVLGFALFVRIRVLPYLVLGVVAVSAAIPQTLLAWTHGTLAAGLVMLVTGATLLASSLIGLRLRRR